MTNAELIEKFATLDEDGLWAMAEGIVRNSPGAIPAVTEDVKREFGIDNPTENMIGGLLTCGAMLVLVHVRKAAASALEERDE
jgi:hypothetical protein